MRTLNGVLLVIMLAFVAVQFNDPDGALWMAIYMVPAVWTAIAIFRNSWLANKFAHALLSVSLFLAAAGALILFPRESGWWRQEIWWEVETVREGIGMMIVFLVLFVVWFSRPKRGASNLPLS